LRWQYRLQRGFRRALALDSFGSKSARARLRGLGTTDLHLTFDASSLGVTLIRDAQDLGVLRAELDPKSLSAQIYLSCNGALFRWAANGLTDDGFRIAALHGATIVFAAAATDGSRKRFLTDLKRLGAQL
jgi:hypothetical protein